MNHRILLASALVAMTTAAIADSPHYIRATGSVDAEGNYVATWKEAGLGSTPVTYTLAAGLGTTFTYQCYTKSDNKPQGAPNSTQPGNYQVTETVTPRNGQVTGSLPMEPFPSQDCQGGGLKLCLVSVAYRSVTLSDGLTPAIPLPDGVRSDFFNSATGKPTVCES
jgi:hypothetical protein